MVCGAHKFDGKGRGVKRLHSKSDQPLTTAELKSERSYTLIFPTPLWLVLERCCFILIDACNSTERRDKLLVVQLKKLPAYRTRSFSKVYVVW